MVYDKLVYVCVTDENQIEHVTCKVSMVETMHDGLRLALEGLRRDVKDGKAGNENCLAPSLVYEY